MGDVTDDEDDEGESSALQTLFGLPTSGPSREFKQMWVVASIYNNLISDFGGNVELDCGRL